MATKIEETARAREPLTRERILAAAVALADEGGVESLSMRRLAQHLGVVPMALYKHVANKDELLDGMIDEVVAEIDPPIEGADWKTTMRERILSARRALLRHPWAASVLESRGEPTPTRHRLHRLDDGRVPGRRLLGRPDASRDARDGQPDPRLLAGAVRRHGQHAG